MIVTITMDNPSHRSERIKHTIYNVTKIEYRNDRKELVLWGDVCSDVEHAWYKLDAIDELIITR